jgi:hypothetical protein
LSRLCLERLFQPLPWHRYFARLAKQGSSDVLLQNERSTKMSFHPFPRLPIEIQQHIWPYALSSTCLIVPKLAELRVAGIILRQAAPPTWPASQSQYLSAIHSLHNGRSILELPSFPQIHHGLLLPIVPINLYLTNGRCAVVYIRPDTDILYLGGESGLSEDLDINAIIRDPISRANIRHLTLNGLHIQDFSILLDTQWNEGRLIHGLENLHTLY